MSKLQEPEVKSPNKYKAAFHSGVQTLLLLLGFAALLTGIIGHTFLFLHIGSWLLGRH